MAQPRKFPFTDDKIERLPVPRGDARVEYADTVTRGLRLRIGSSGARTFLLFDRDQHGRRTRETIGRWSRTGLGGTFTVEAARAKYLDLRGEKEGRGSATATVGELLDLFIERGQTSAYTASILRKHVEPLRHLVAAQVAPVVLSDLVAKVQAGYTDGKGQAVGGSAVADKVRSGLRSLFAWAQRQGRFPPDRALPTNGLVREDFADIGWKARERVPSESELHQLFDALGIGTGERIVIDLKKSPRVSLAARLAVLALLHVPVRSGAGILSQPTSAADLDARILRWTTRKGGRTAEIETPLSLVAVGLLRELRQLPGGDAWIVPSPEPPADGKPWRPIDLKVLARMFVRLQAPGGRGEPPRIRLEEGQEPFTPHCLRALWVTLAGEIGIDDGTAVRVIGHQPEGASKAQRFYDRSRRVEAQRDAVERVSAELERIRRREPRKAAEVVALQAPG
jgi:hypothetical protein